MTAESRALRMTAGARGEPRKRAKKENQQEEPRKKSPKEEPNKEKTTRQYQGKTDTGGWEDSSLTLRMTAESRDRSQNDSWVERRTRKRAKKENQQEEQREKNQKEEPKRNHPPVSGKTDTGGW